MKSYNGPDSRSSSAQLSGCVRRGRSQRLIVSIHDITPAFTTEVGLILRDLDTIGAAPRVLMVVPSAAGCTSIRDAPELVRLLQDETLAGSEIILHGYTHNAVEPFRGTWPSRLRARLFARDTAEFLTLDGDQLAERLDMGKRMLCDLGLEPRGFCAPGWLAPPGILPILRRSGFHYYVGMSSIYDLYTGRRKWVPWTGYMGTSSWHENLVGLGSAILMGIAPLYEVVNVYLHPQGVPESKGYQRALRILAHLLHERRTTTYDRLLDR